MPLNMETKQHVREKKIKIIYKHIQKQAIL